MGWLQEVEGFRPEFIFHLPRVNLPVAPQIRGP